MPRYLPLRQRPMWRLSHAVACLLLAGLVASGCGKSRRKTTPPAGAVTIERISIRAAPEQRLTIESGPIVSGLALERSRTYGEPFERYLVSVDAERIRGYYVRHGFFRAQVKGDVEREGRAVKVNFEVTEGPRAKLARVEIVGLPEASGLALSDIRDLIPLRDGGTFDYEAFELAKPIIVDTLTRAGYAFAKFEASVAADVVLNHAIIRIELTPGPLCHFGEVKFVGIGGKLGRAARARIPLREGGRYSSAKIAETQANLYDMNRFSLIKIEPDLSVVREEIPVVITVMLSTRRELRLGGGFGINPTSYEIRGRSTYNITGYPLMLTNTRLELRPALVRLRDTGQTEPRIEAIAAIDRIDLFRPLTKGELETAFSYRTVEAYTSVGPRLRLALRSPLWGLQVQGELGWQLEVLQFRDIHPAIGAALQADLGLDGLNRVGAFSQTVVVDLRDSPVAPTRGGYAELRLEEGSAIAGGAFDYVRVMPDVRGYLSLGRVVLAGRGRLGAFFGDVPVASRFYGGGANSQRGFAERRLSPSAIGTNEDGDTISVIYGGGAMVEAGGELRFPLGSILGLDLGGVTFLDGGDVTETFEDLELSRLHWAFGAGLRVPTIIGAIRLDVGYRLNRVGGGEPYPGHRFAFHLNIGEAF